MKPFDIEAAKRGALFIHRMAPRDSERVARRFIGYRSNGSAVYEQVNGEISWAPEAELRMLPEKRTVFVNIMESGRAAWFISAYAANAAEHTCPVITRAVPIEIED
jgi:hypothetical protein